MAANLITSVRTQIGRLKKEIDQRSSHLASLKDELKKHQRVYRLLGGPDRRPRRRRRARGRTRRAAPVNWNSVLNQLPTRFTIGDIAKATDAKGKSPVYLRQIAVRWAKQGKTKRVERGRYIKVQQGKAHVAAGLQRRK